MVEAHSYCAELNFICFLVFSAVVLLISSYPEGGHPRRRAADRAPLLLAAAI